jgi:hypothetical protein
MEILFQKTKLIINKDLTRYKLFDQIRLWIHSRARGVKLSNAQKRNLPKKFKNDNH